MCRGETGSGMMASRGSAVMIHSVLQAQKPRTPCPSRLRLHVFFSLGQSVPTAGVWNASQTPVTTAPVTFALTTPGHSQCHPRPTNQFLQRKQQPVKSLCSGSTNRTSSRSLHGFCYAAAVRVHSILQILYHLELTTSPPPALLTDSCNWSSCD